jgi:hypothetical protein
MQPEKSSPRTGQGARAEVEAGQATDHRKDTSPAPPNLGPVHDALTMTAWGWRVFACAPGSKAPALRKCADAEGLTGDRLAVHARTCPGEGHGFHDATDDPDEVLVWFDAVPTRNVAVATGAVSALVVLDVDPGGAATLARLQEEHGPLPRTLSSLTPRGGVHGFYRHPGRPVPCSASKLGPNLDVRADGGYVLVPPSVVDGTPYRWRSEPWPAPTIAELPAAWLDLLAAEVDPPRPARRVTPPTAGVAGRLAAWTTAAVRGELEAVTSAPVGTRNHTLNRAAFRLGKLTAAGALDADAARTALEAAAAACGLGPGEAARTIASGFAAGLAEPAELPEVAA